MHHRIRNAFILNSKKNWPVIVVTVIVDIWKVTRRKHLPVIEYASKSSLSVDKTTEQWSKIGGFKIDKRARVYAVRYAFDEWAIDRNESATKLVVYKKGVQWPEI